MASSYHLSEATAIFPITNKQPNCSQLRQMHQDTPEINTNSSNLIAHQAYQCSVTKAIVWQSWVYVVVPVILKHQGKGLHQQLV